MIESPVIRKVRADTHHDAICVFLKARFGSVGRDVIRPLRKILDEKWLLDLVRLAATCADMDAFREALEG